MTIEDLGRAAAGAARRKAAREVEPTLMLRKLHRSHRNRSLVASGGAALAVAIVAVLLARGLTPSVGGQAPGGPRASTPPSTTCPADRTCLGGDRFLVTLPVPVTVTVPGTFQGALSRLGVNALEDYRNDLSTTGVTILENATAVKDDRTWTADPSAGTTAASMARWLSRRPFLLHGTLTRTSVGGRAAWLVTGVLRPGVHLAGLKNGTAAGPTFAVDGATTGYTHQLTGQYILLDLPGAGVTVIWSWTLGHGVGALAGNQAFIDTLSFG